MMLNKMTIKLEGIFHLALRLGPAGRLQHLNWRELY
jgi:hypothetical protein